MYTAPELATIRLVDPALEMTPPVDAAPAKMKSLPSVKLEIPCDIEVPVPVLGTHEPSRGLASVVS